MRLSTEIMGKRHRKGKGRFSNKGLNDILDEQMLEIGTEEKSNRTETENRKGINSKGKNTGKVNRNKNRKGLKNGKNLIQNGKLFANKIDVDSINYSTASDADLRTFIGPKKVIRLT